MKGTKALYFKLAKPSGIISIAFAQFSKMNQKSVQKNLIKRPNFERIPRCLRHCTLGVLCMHWNILRNKNSLESNKPRTRFSLLQSCAHTTDS